MKSIIIVKKGVSLSSGVNIIGGNINLIPVSAFAVYGDGAKLITPTDTASVNDIEIISFLQKVGTTSKDIDKTVSIHTIPLIRRRDVYDVDYVPYKAGQKQEKTIGSATVLEKALRFENEGTVSMSIGVRSAWGFNYTYFHTISNTKKAYETPEEFVNKVILSLNDVNKGLGNINKTKFFNAIKVGSGTTLGIKLSALSEQFDLEISVSGMWAGSYIETTTPAKIGNGEGRDVLRLEQDCSVYKGNGNYEYRREDFYSQPFLTDSEEKYDMFHIRWVGKVRYPSTTVQSTPQELYIAVPIREAITSDIKSLLSLCFSKAFDNIQGTINVFESDPITPTLDLT